MYPSIGTTSIATQPGRRVTDVVQGREGFRPVALPALAAAVHVGTASAQAARAKAAAGRSPRIVHEDEPAA